MTKTSKPTPNSGDFGIRKSKIENRRLLAESVVFFGTGPVAAASLELLAQWATIEAVITKPKPPHHKGSFPVLDAAEKLNLPVLSVTDKKSLDELMLSRPLRSRLGVLVDFGIIVSQAVIDYFELGIINSHFSLLPEWRGADPITSAILSGQKQTGVSLMLLVEKMDEGPLLAQTPYELDHDVTAQQLTNDLIELSDYALRQVLPLYAKGQTQTAPQEQVALPGHTTPSYSRKLIKGDGLLDPIHKPAVQLEREVRAYAGWPKSRTTIGNIEVIVTKAHVIGGQGKPGTLYRTAKELGFYTIDDIFVIDSLKPAGKKEMTTVAFLNGYKLEP